MTNWQEINKFPINCAISEIFSLEDKIIFIGGYNGSSPFSSYYIGTYGNNKVTWSARKTLPKAFGLYPTGFKRDNVLYVTGGNTTTTSLNIFTTIQLNKTKDALIFEEFPSNPVNKVVGCFRHLKKPDVALYIGGRIQPSTSSSNTIETYVF